jgi:hypothetical protein
MPAVYATFPKTTLKFFLPTDLQAPIKKKLANLGWPEPWLTYSFDKKLKLKDCGNGFFNHSSGEFGESIPIIKPTEHGNFSANYDEKDNLITYEFSGEFLVFGYTDESEAVSYKKITEGYISLLKILDSKGKQIKLPKDEYGMALPLEGTAQPASYDGYIKVNLKISSVE